MRETASQSVPTARHDSKDTALPALSATIDTVTVFGQSATFAKPITKYLGDQLYCNAWIDSAGMLYLDINDNGVEELSPTGSATQATVTVTYQGLSTEAVTISSINSSSSSGPLALSAIVGDETSTTQKLALVVDVPAIPLLQVAYVIVQDQDNTYQLRWIENPVNVSSSTTPKTARVRPPVNGGGGVSGPMGTQTP